MQKNIERIVVGPIETNCWLYPLEPENESSGARPCVVIDPGGEAGKIVVRLRELNWVPGCIFLTHGHFDHVMGLPDLLEACGTFPGMLRGNTPKISIHRLDAHYLGKAALAAHRESLSAVGGESAFVDALWKPLPEPDVFFEEGAGAGPFMVLHTPGHSPGSVCLYDEKAAVLFSGDTLFRGTWGRTDLPGGNETQIHQSLKRLLAMKGETLVCPGHGPATTIKAEEGLLLL